MPRARGNHEGRETLHGLPRGLSRPSSSLPYADDDERPTNRSRELSIFIVAMCSFLVNFLLVNGAVVYRDATTMPPPPSPHSPPPPSRPPPSPLPPLSPPSPPSPPPAPPAPPAPPSPPTAPPASPPPPPGPCGNYEIRPNVQPDHGLASTLYISPASDRLLNTYIFPVNDATSHADAAAPPVPTQCCDLCHGDLDSPKTLYNDVGRTSEFTNCDVFYLEHVPMVGWVCTFASATPTLPATHPSGHIFGYFMR